MPALEIKTSPKRSKTKHKSPYKLSERNTSISKYRNNDTLNETLPFHRNSPMLYTQRRSLTRTNWFVHKGRDLRFSASRDRSTLRFDNSDCLPLIKNQYTKFINLSRQGFRRPSPVTRFTESNLETHNRIKIKKLATKLLGLLRDDKLSDVNFYELYPYAKFNKISLILQMMLGDKKGTELQKQIDVDTIRRELNAILQNIEKNRQTQKIRNADKS